jgi:hypothetical protein
MSSSVRGPRVPERDDVDASVGDRRGLPPWVAHYWWAVLVVGIVLIVVGALTQSDLWTIGVAFSIGLICTIAGLGGGLQRLRKPGGRRLRA